MSEFRLIHLFQRIFVLIKFNYYKHILYYISQLAFLFSFFCSSLSSLYFANTACKLLLLS